MARHHSFDEFISLTLPDFNSSLCMYTDIFPFIYSEMNQLATCRGKQP